MKLSDIFIGWFALVVNRSENNFFIGKVATPSFFLYIDVQVSWNIAFIRGFLTKSSIGNQFISEQYQVTVWIQNICCGIFTLHCNIVFCSVFDLIFSEHFPPAVSFKKKIIQDYSWTLFHVKLRFVSPNMLVSCSCCVDYWKIIKRCCSYLYFVLLVGACDPFLLDNDII